MILIPLTTTYSYNSTGTLRMDIDKLVTGKYVFAACCIWQGTLRNKSMAISVKTGQAFLYKN